MPDFGFTPLERPMRHARRVLRRTCVNTALKPRGER